MARYWICLFWVLAGLEAPSLAADQVVEVKWGALGALVANQKVALVLPDGTNIQGKAMAAEDDGLRMKVSKTSILLPM